MFTAQTGNFFTVYPNSISTPDNIKLRAIRTGNPYSGGGSAPANNPSISCPSSVKNHEHWFNPCAFETPGTRPQAPTIRWPRARTPPATTTRPSLDTSADAATRLPYRGDQRANASIFKSFKVYREQKLHLHRCLQPFDTRRWATRRHFNIEGNGGRITSTVFAGRNMLRTRASSSFLPHYAF